MFRFSRALENWQYIVQFIIRQELTALKDLMLGGNLNKD